MRIRLEGDPGELKAKAPEILRRFARELAKSSPDVSVLLEAIEKASLPKQRKLQDKGLDDIEKRIDKVYQDQIAAMIQRIGNVLDASVDNVEKAQGHKYIRRVPTGKTDPKYRYYYTETSSARQARSGEDVVVGEKKLKIHEVEHDGTIHYTDQEGESKTVSHEQWTSMMVAHHGERYLEWAEKRARGTIESILKLVPKELLKDLAGKNDRERLEDLKRRVPDVYAKLKGSFSRTGMSPHAAKRMLSFTLERKGWHQDARAHLIGSVLEPGGAELAKNYRQVARGAENLAGGRDVKVGHVSAAIELRRPSKPGGDYIQEIAAIAKSAEEELSKLSQALARARENPGDRTIAAVLAQSIASSSMAKLQLLAQAYPGLQDRAIQPVRDAFAEIASVSPRIDATKSGAKTTVFVAGDGGQPKALAGRYRLVEADEVTPSHNPQSFRPNTKYPEAVQERAYHRDPGEQDKVRRNAQRMNPEFVVNTNPDAVNGPPIVTTEGIVLGGNSRTMSMQRIYQDHPEKADEMRRYLAANAHQFGFKPHDVEALKNPVLVREIDPEDRSKQNLQLLVRQMNESFTQAMDPRTMQVAMGRRISDKTLGTLADSMKDSDTLNDFLSSPRSERFVSSLFSNGIIDERNANQYTRKGTRQLNADGKAFVERILVGRIVEDADVMSETRPATMSAIARSVPYLVQAEAYGKGYDLRKELRTALSAYNDIAHLADSGAIKMPDAKTSERDMLNVMDNLRQLPGVGEDHPVLKDERAATMLRVMVYQGGPNQMARVFREYAALASKNPEGQAQLLGEKISPAKVFSQSVEAAIKRGAREETESKPKPSESQPEMF